MLIAFGDWEQRQGISFGKEATKGKGMRTMFINKKYELYLIDEFRTSKLCNRTECSNSILETQCIKRNKEDLRGLWGLVRCKNENCTRVYNRDRNSSVNIYNKAKEINENKEKNENFQRGKPLVLSNGNQDIELIIQTPQTKSDKK